MKGLFWTCHVHNNAFNKQGVALARSRFLFVLCQIISDVIWGHFSYRADLQFTEIQQFKWIPFKSKHIQQQWQGQNSFKWPLAEPNSVLGLSMCLMQIFLFFLSFCVVFFYVNLLDLCFLYFIYIFLLYTLLLFLACICFILYIL